MVLLVVIVMVVGGFYWFYDVVFFIVILVKVFIVDRGSEYFLVFILDGERLVYMYYDGYCYWLFVKLVVFESVVEICYGKEEGVGLGSWNDKGNKLVYLVVMKDKC